MRKNEGTMTFNEHFGFSFYDMSILVDREKHERTRQHEGGHEWIGREKKAELVGKTFNPGGVSHVEFREFKDLQDYYEVGVAGLLAEALSMQRKVSQDCKIDLKRLPALANQIYEQLREEDPNPKNDHAIEPRVPMTCDFPSAVWGQVSVSDMTVPIKSKLEEGRILAALKTVATQFNEIGEWDTFQKFVDATYPKYEE
jgi:hypothetical protein